MRPVRSVGTASSACWLCAVLDVISALSLPSATSAQDPRDGALWGGGRTRTRDRREDERRRYVRSSGPYFSRRYAMDAHDFAVNNRDLRVTEVLQFIDALESSKPRPENCTDTNRAIYIHNYRFDEKYFKKPFQAEAEKAIHLANVLNNLFLFTKEHKADVHKNVTFFALTQSIVDSEPRVKGCGIVFEKNQYPDSQRFFFPYSYRDKNGVTVVSDLTRMYYPFNMSWFLQQRLDSKIKALKRMKTIFTNSTYDVNRFQGSLVSVWNQSVRVNESNGYWEQPYYDCMLEAWILQFTVPFYEVDVSGTTTFKGVVLLDLDLLSLEINQCAKKESGSLFAGSHHCRPESTKCVNIPGNGLKWGSYECQCKPEFYFPDSKAQNKSFYGRQVELAYLESIKNNSFNYSQGFMCLPCRKGCENCEGDEPCIVEFDVLLRGIPLGIQSFCMTIALVVGFVIARLRKTKVMRSSVWVLLEMIVLGALLLYATVVIQYFEPTATNCLLVPWFREVGFAIFYGTLVLKVYRILAEFQSRKAHRVHVRDKDLLKSLAVILVVVIGYMAAWTAVNADHLEHGASLLDTGTTSDNLSYVLCKSLWWDYVIEFAEVFFLVVGVYLCYCVRAAPSDYSERCYVTVAIVYELLLSTGFYILKHLWWFKLHPDYLFLMYFLRCQLTVTVNLLILLGPKLWYAHRPPDDDRMRTRAYSQSDVGDSTAPETMKLNVGISSNGDVDVGEISLTEMDPEDIRAELKRLYTQLQIYKTKTMRKDNPHISKRRGGRKQTHRRFSLQAFHHKHRHHHEHEHEHEMSKTPEESTNSAENITFPMEPSVKEDPNEGSTGGSAGSTSRNPPSVSFKPGHT